MVRAATNKVSGWDVSGPIKQKNDQGVVQGISNNEKFGRRLSGVSSSDKKGDKKGDKNGVVPVTVLSGNNANIAGNAG